MKKSEETLEDFAISYPLDKLAPLEQILFLDIETTGFTSRTSYLYMIGCAYYQAGKWRTIQWMGIFSLLSLILQETTAIWYISTAIILTFPLSPRNARS